MVINRLVFPEGNNLKFTVDHKEDGVEYTLQPDEEYYILIDYMAAGKQMQLLSRSSTKYFDTDTYIEPGIYAYEIGIYKTGLPKRIIAPAYDERGRMLNQLIILKKIAY